jgi:hypothetical protein
LGWHAAKYPQKASNQVDADHMNLRAIHGIGFFLFAAGLAAGTHSARAQGVGPMTPPASTQFPTPPPPSKPEPPSLPLEEIIRRFAAKEDEMNRAITGYAFQKSVHVEEIGPDGKPTGQLEIVTQQILTADGKLLEKPVRRTPSTLHSVDIERGDPELLVATPMFPLMTSQLSKYVIAFGGKQPLDELSAYFFSVKPRALDRMHPYFSGVVWVDEQDLVIVKMIGKWVTETGDFTSPTLPFAVFETYRQQVGKNYWFPSYSRSDETIEVGGTSVPMRMIVRWTDFTPLAGVPSAVTPSVDKTPPSKVLP